MATSNCKQCGASFEPRKPTQRYCSRPCARKNNGKNQNRECRPYLNQRGYVLISVKGPDGRRIRKRLHRVVMEGIIGRPLLPHEDVHHKNGVRTDNRPENLELLTHVDHAKLTSVTRVYPRGYRSRISDEERKRRREWLSQARKSGRVSRQTTR